MKEWQDLPADLQSLMEKRVADRRAEENATPDEERRQNDRRGDQAEPITPETPPTPLG